MSDKKLILIVDDEPDMVDWLKAFFEDNGYATVFAHDGTDGFELAQNKKPDLITLDITMDKETGIRMYRKLHEDDGTADIPVIMITGVSPEFKRWVSSRSQVEAPNGYFEKPVDRDALLSKVKELIG
jgi:two-component system alkaline phosphatase synthesis response regulator PhoP